MLSLVNAAHSAFTKSFQNFVTVDEKAFTMTSNQKGCLVFDLQASLQTCPSQNSGISTRPSIFAKQPLPHQASSACFEVSNHKHFEQ
jgi:hypothetical protein